MGWTCAPDAGKNAISLILSFLAVAAVIFVIGAIVNSSSKRSDKKQEENIAASDAGLSSMKSQLANCGFSGIVRQIPDEAFFRKQANTTVIAGFAPIFKNYSSFIFAWDSSYSKFAVMEVGDYSFHQPMVYEKSQLLDYSLYKNGSMVPRGSSGSVLLGALVFGTAGAIAGAADAASSTELCTDLTIEIILKNTYKPRVSLRLLNHPESTISSDYREKAEMAQEILAVLKNIKES